MALWNLNSLHSRNWCPKWGRRHLNKKINNRCKCRNKYNNNRVNSKYCNKKYYNKQINYKNNIKNTVQASISLLFKLSKGARKWQVISRDLNRILLYNIRPLKINHLLKRIFIRKGIVALSNRKAMKESKTKICWLKACRNISRSQMAYSLKQAPIVVPSPR